MEKVRLIDNEVITVEEKNFYSKILDELDVVFDVGAFLTFFRGDNVHYFEPIPNRFEELKRQVNNCGFLNNFGLGKDSGTAIIYNGLSSSYFRQHGAANVNNTMDITLETLDSYVNDNNINEISLLKIDVEGAELDVLMGGVKSLNKCKYIVFEYSDDTAEAANMTYKDIKNLLESNGFEIFDLSPEGELISVDENKLTSRVMLFNLVAINNNKLK